MTVFTENARASRCRRVFGGGAFRLTSLEDQPAVLHEGRMYTRNVKACRSTEERPSLDVSPQTFAAAA